MKKRSRREESVLGSQPSQSSKKGEHEDEEEEKDDEEEHEVPEHPRTKRPRGILTFPSASDRAWLTVSSDSFRFARSKEAQAAQLPTRLTSLSIIR